MGKRINDKEFEYMKVKKFEKLTPWGIVFDIKRLSYDDGPGLRTTVFLKGCPLHCLWCHSPESQTSKPQLVFYQNKCVLCGRCVAVCPEGVHNLQDAKHQINWEKCKNCGKCTELCPTVALEIKGRKFSVQKLFKEILKDKVFYINSGGGVTISGGEPLNQAEFVKAVFELCQKEGIHTALDTSGFSKTELLKLVIPYTDLFLFDLKHMDDREHRRLTGVSNGLIHSNLRLLAEMDKDIQIRVPLIPGYNDMDENILATAEFVSSLGITQIAFLPYNKMAGSKYTWMGRKYTLEEITPQTSKDLDHIRKIAAEHNLGVQIGG